MCTQAVGRIKLKAVYLHVYQVGSYISLANLHKQLRVLYYFLFGHLAAGGSKTVEVRLLVIVVHIAALFKVGKRGHLCQFHTLLAHLGSHALGRLAHIDAELGLLLRFKALKLAVGRIDSHHEFALAVGIGRHRGTCTLAAQVRLCFAIVIILAETICASCRRIYFVSTVVLAYLRRVVVGVGHRNDGIGLHKHGQLPQRCIVSVDNASTLVHIAIVIVHPTALGQINAIAYVVAVLVHLRFLIYRCYKE